MQPGRVAHVLIPCIAARSAGDTAARDRVSHLDRVSQRQRHCRAAAASSAFFALVFTLALLTAAKRRPPPLPPLSSSSPPQLWRPYGRFLPAVAPPAVAHYRPQRTAPAAAAARLLWQQRWLSRQHRQRRGQPLMLSRSLRRRRPATRGGEARDAAGATTAWRRRLRRAGARGLSRPTTG